MAGSAWTAGPQALPVQAPAFSLLVLCISPRAAHTPCTLAKLILCSFRPPKPGEAPGSEATAGLAAVPWKTRCHGSKE